MQSFELNDNFFVKFLLKFKFNFHHKNLFKVLNIKESALQSSVLYRNIVHFCFVNYQTLD